MTEERLQEIEHFAEIGNSSCFFGCRDTIKGLAAEVRRCWSALDSAKLSDVQCREELERAKADLEVWNKAAEENAKGIDALISRAEAAERALADHHRQIYEKLLQGANLLGHNGFEIDGFSGDPTGEIIAEVDQLVGMIEDHLASHLCLRKHGPEDRPEISKCYLCKLSRQAGDGRYIWVEECFWASDRWRIHKDFTVLEWYDLSTGEGGE